MPNSEKKNILLNIQSKFVYYLILLFADTLNDDLLETHFWNV